MATFLLASITEILMAFPLSACVTSHNLGVCVRDYLGSITSRCSGNEPALLPQTQPRDYTPFARTKVQGV